MLALVQFTNIMDFMIMMPLGTQFMRIFEITPQQFSVLVSSYTLTAGVVGFICSFFLDRFDRKPSLLLTYIGFMLGTLACAMAPGYHVLLLARIFTGIFGGILSAQVLAIVSDSFGYERRAYAMSFISASFSLASVLGVPVGLYLAATFSWHTPFYSIAGLALVITVMIHFFIPSQRAHLHHDGEKNPFRNFAGILKNRNQLLALLFIFMLILGQFTIIPFIAPYMVYNVGFTEYQISFIYLLGGGITIFTSPYIGKLADRKGKPLIFLIAAAFTLIPLFVITHLPPVPIYLALIVTSFFFIFIAGRMTVAMTMFSGTVTARQRGALMSLNACVQMLGAGIASLISGAVVTQLPDKQLQHYSTAGFIAIGATIMAMIISRSLKVTDAPIQIIPQQDEVSESVPEMIKK